MYSHLTVLHESFPMITNMTGLLMKVAIALKGLKAHRRRTSGPLVPYDLYEIRVL